MDVNSYSYTGAGFLGTDHRVALYENDDMCSSIDMAARGNVGAWVSGFEVFSESYDGSLEVIEFFRTIKAARYLHDNIIANYSHCAPTRREVRALIRHAHKLDNEEARI